MRPLRAALAAAIILGAPALLAAPALAQPTAQTESIRALRTAEDGLRDTIQRIDEGGMAGSASLSRLRQALNEVERAMLQMPADARAGAPWQTAVREVSEAMAALRDEATSPADARTQAGEALGTLPVLRGEETGSTGG